MWFHWRDKPTGRQLFHVCLIASFVAALVGTATLLVCCAMTEYDPVAGREFRYLWLLLIVITAFACVMHYPWSPRWAAANGCRPDGDGGVTDAALSSVTPHRAEEGEDRGTVG
jgi:hypothetical protein